MKSSLKLTGSSNAFREISVIRSTELSGTVSGITPRQYFIRSTSFEFFIHNLMWQCTFCRRSIKSHYKMYTKLLTVTKNKIAYFINSIISVFYDYICNCSIIEWLNNRQTKNLKLYNLLKINSKKWEYLRTPDNLQHLIFIRFAFLLEIDFAFGDLFRSYKCDLTLL